MNITLQAAGLVASGGFAGAVCRYKLSSAIAKRFPSVIPYGTLTVNLTGCFLIGLLLGNTPEESLLLLAGTGFLGAFTTFSTFQLENLHMLLGKDWRSLLLYSGASYFIGILMAFAGYLL